MSEEVPGPSEGEATLPEGVPLFDFQREFIGLAMGGGVYSAWPEWDEVDPTKREG